jgi:hypothetical protein
MRFAGYGTWRHTEIDMEKIVLEERSDSSGLQSGRNLESSRKRTRRRSKDAGDEAAGSAAERKQELYDLLLTQLQSLIGEIREAGVEVRLYRSESGLFVKLPGTSVCPKHLIVHSGMACLHCQTEQSSQGAQSE